MDIVKGFTYLALEDLLLESYSLYPPFESFRRIISYDGVTIHAIEAPYIYSTGPSSPSLYHDDADIRNLSLDSASSSNTGSLLFDYG